MLVSVWVAMTWKLNLITWNILMKKEVCLKSFSYANQHCQAFLAKKHKYCFCCFLHVFYLALKSSVKINGSNLSNLQDIIYHLLRWVLTLEETTRCFITGIKEKKKKKKEGEQKRRGKDIYTMDEAILGTGFSPCYRPWNPWGEFSPWYCYLVHKRSWFFSAARYY